MTLNDLQSQGRLRPHKTSGKEVDDLLRLAERDLRDARVAGVSTDRRFMIAYEAAVALATIPLHRAGFRTDGTGLHQTTFLALPLVMGAEVSGLAGYFDSCRTKRNVSSYDRSGQVPETEATELFREAMQFKEVVESWLRINHPKLVAP
jgi:hypothetical protein